MYGSVLSGGLSGHVHGTSAYDMTSTGEPAGARPHFWDALKYESGGYMQYLAAFILSEGDKYQQLQLGSENIHPQKAPDSPPRGLDGWSFMMITAEKDFALLYFENKAVLPTLSGFKPDTSYKFQWYNPSNGQWKDIIVIKTDEKGVLTLPSFPEDQSSSTTDWSAKILKCQ
jgi:hypothetical protein